jgi:hypothetical protein
MIQETYSVSIYKGSQPMSLNGGKAQILHRYLNLRYRIITGDEYRYSRELKLNISYMVFLLTYF